MNLDDLDSAMDGIQKKIEANENAKAQRAAEKELEKKPFYVFIETVLKPAFADLAETLAAKKYKVIPYGSTDEYGAQIYLPDGNYDNPQQFPGPIVRYYRHQPITNIVFAFKSFNTLAMKNGSLLQCPSKLGDTIETLETLEGLTLETEQKRIIEALTKMLSNVKLFGT